MYEAFISLPYRDGFHVVSDCYDIISEIENMYGMYVRNTDIFNMPSTLITIAKEKNTYIVSYLGQRIVTNSPLVNINGLLMHETSYSDAVFALHGAAVEYGKKAYVFLASTTTGKTTLTSYLTSNGFGYITDDCVLICRETLDILPCQTPIHLRQGGIKVLSEYNSLPKQDCHVINSLREKRYTYTPNNCVTSALPIDKVFFIERTDSVNVTREVSSVEKIELLIKSPIIPYDIDTEYLRFITKLAKKLDCKHLQYSDFEFVSDLIRTNTANI